MRTGKKTVIVGLGKTGVSCARFFSAKGADYSVLDDDPSTERLAELNAINPTAFSGGIIESELLSAHQLVLSPGVSPGKEEIREAVAAGVPVTGDVEIFSHEVKSPMIAITGSNGKSTVTRLVGHLLKACGYKVGIGGNLGNPCLDLLGENPDFYVIEISSFQIDTASSLPCEVATVLNLTPDHMNRYASVNEYYQSKASIFSNCKIAVVNRDTNYKFETGTSKLVTFGSDLPKNQNEYGLIEENGLWLARGKRKLVGVDDLAIRGKHNALNALAALAICHSLGLSDNDMIAPITEFQGLEHRCEWIGQFDGIDFYNDSKSTNISSTLAAIEGLGKDLKNIILILGGQSKEADFSQLNTVIGKYVKNVLVYGQDARLIEGALDQQVTLCSDLEDLISTAMRIGEKQNLVLFSPGCASFDMFSGFEERGEKFKSEVRRLVV